METNEAEISLKAGGIGAVELSGGAPLDASVRIVFAGSDPGAFRAIPAEDVTATVDNQHMKLFFLARHCGAETLADDAQRHWEQEKQAKSGPHYPA